MGKPVNGMVPRSGESVTTMTSYGGFPWNLKCHIFYTPCSHKLCAPIRNRIEMDV